MQNKTTAFVSRVKVGTSTVIGHTASGGRSCQLKQGRKGRKHSEVASGREKTNLVKV